MDQGQNHTVRLSTHFMKTWSNPWGLQPSGDSGSCKTVLLRIQPMKQLPFCVKFRRVLSSSMENEWFPHIHTTPTSIRWIFFSSGELVRITSTRNTPDLKAAVEVYVQTVTIKTCRNVIENVTTHVNACCVCGGAHIEHLNYKRINA